MGRATLAVIAGYAAWTVLWLAGNNLLFSAAGAAMAAQQRFTAAGTLAAIVALSIVCSLVAGAVAAAIARLKARGAVLVMALLLLATGIGVQASVWRLMPVWYHLVFLALIVPVCLLGGRLVGAPRGAA